MNALERYELKRHLTVKLAKVRMSDIEDDLDVLLDRKHHPEVRDKIKKRTAKSFALRHPLLTGIPTLGIAPAIAKDNAVRSISRGLLRDHKGLRREHGRAKDRRRKREMEDEKLSIERARAEAPVRAVGAAVAGASPAALKYLEMRRAEQRSAK
jgi:hypothetical protein